MRGGFVACVGGEGDLLDRVVERMRWHRGKPLRLEADGFQVAAFVDPVEGPVVDVNPGFARLVHGAAPAPLGQLQRRAPRFAAIEWDGRRLRAGRDPLGLAPLFYRVFRGGVWLATEVGPLVALGRVDPDLEALAARAAFVPLDERTGWQGIARVLPGATLEVEAPGHVSSVPCWTPAALQGGYRGDRRAALEEFRARLRTAVARCYEPGSGVYLSGGLDSAAVALTAAAGPPGPYLVHVHFADMPQTHEDRYAAAVAQAVGTPLHVVPGDVEPWDLSAELDTFSIPYNWLPFGMDRPVLAHLAKAGVTVALDGHDGDGVLGPTGSEWGDLVRHGEARRLAGLVARHGAWAALRGTLSDFTPRQPWLWRLTGRAPRQTYMQGVARYFRPPLARRILEADINRWRWPSRRWRDRQIQPLLPRATIAFEHKELEAASHGLDMRHPFADRDLVEFLISLPSAVKADPRRPKSVLLDALEGILPSILTARPKSDYMAVVRRRVDPMGCVEVIRASGVRLPSVDYDRLFADPGPESPVLFFLLVNLARVHEFARRAA